MKGDWFQYDCCSLCAVVGRVLVVKIFDIILKIFSTNNLQKRQHVHLIHFGRDDDDNDDIMIKSSFRRINNDDDDAGFL